MHSSRTSSNAIAFCVASIIAQSLGELILLRDDLTQGGFEKKLTCVSEDDDGALIWNHNLNGNDYQQKSYHFTNFQPNKTTANNVTNCAIRNSTKCVVRWGEKGNWDVVNSAKNPMGPVFDYRWEGFEEIVFDTHKTEQEYKYVGEVDKSGTVVFSVRALRNVHVLLCENVKSRNDVCFLIIIGGLGGQLSEIRKCPETARRTPRSMDEESCEVVASIPHGPRDIVYIYEWRTFTLNWSKKDKTIQVFKDTDRKKEPFLRATFEKFNDVDHILTRGEISTRIRFHFYDYYMTEKKNSKLYTEEINNHSEKRFCVEMLVGLCPKCELAVNLISTKGWRQNIENISGGKYSNYKDLLVWRLVRLSKNVDPNGLKLEIQTMMNKGNGKGPWAIGSLQTCRSNGGLRQSTITIRVDENNGVRIWPQVNCQKLSYNDRAVVSSVFRNATDEDSHKLEQVVGEWTMPCASGCPSFGKISSFCNSAGCTCARGFKGFECDEECPTGYHGYNCKKKCGLCNAEPCNTTTGYCSAGCNDKKFLPPLCLNVLEDPEILIIANTTARAIQKVQREAGVEIDLQLKIENIPEYYIFAYKSSSEGSSIYEANITNLKPNRMYGAQTTARVKFQGQETYVESQNFHFQTADENPPRIQIPDIQDLHIDSISESEVTLKRKAPLLENGVQWTYNASIKLDKLLGCEELNKTTPRETEIWKIVDNGTASFSNLHPYAIYTVTVVALRPIHEKPTTKVFQTRPTDIPTSVVSNLRVTYEYPAIEWDKPENCTTITGPTNVTKLIFEGVSNWVRNWTKIKVTELSSFLLIEFDLANYTQYSVRVHVIRGANQDENPAMYQNLTWRTPPTRPPAVTALEIYEADPDANTISLRWLPPQRANGNIELYQVLIGKKNESFYQKKTIYASEARSSCAKMENYVCFRNLTLPENVIASKPEIQVSAKNENVTELGPLQSIVFNPKLYFKVPSRPQNLIAVPKAHGIVILTWSHPSKSYTTISKFHIRVDFLDTKLQENIKGKFPKVKECPGSPERKNYTTKLYLPTSSSYQISVVAMNVENLNSSQAQVNTSVTDGVAFSRKGKLQASQDGALIDLKIPGVVNATVNTLVTVTVNGIVECSGKRSSKWAAEYTPDKQNPKFLRIGDNENSNNSSKCSLYPGETYQITVNVKDSDARLSTTFPMASSSTMAFSEQQSLIWLIIIPIITVCLLLILFIWHRNRKSPTVEMSYSEILRKTSLENLTDFGNRQSSTPPPIESCKDRLSHVYAVPFVSDSKTVSLTCFEEYAKNAATNGELNSQFTKLPRGLTRQCEYGRLPQNMPKNRNQNRIAYDHTRVVLDKIPGDPYSDYINANYIQGYGEKVVYIATQGPKPNTVNDFWRMISQKGVRVICMLTNLVENGKTMCEQYWPEVGAKKTYGNITISNTNRMVYADYTLRTFRLSNGKETRKVTHLHYTGWPDHGVPMYSQSLVTFLKKLVETLDGHGPVVIHCSEGDGRTGTIILCDICVRQGIVEREIEVPAVTKRMYESRANMLDNPQQYLLAHVIITESIMSIPTQIPCNDVLSTRIKTLRKQLLPHVQRLNDTVWQERALHSSAGSQRKISGSLRNNKLPELIPDTYELVENSLYSGFENETNYINAVSVDGVRVKEQYLASQLPSVSGLPDFWRFIAERNVELIILLQPHDPNDPMICDIMPGDSILVPVPYIQVKTNSSLKENELFTIDKLMLTDTSEGKARPQSVTVLTLNGWECGGKRKPPTPAALVSLWQASENIPRKEGTTLVLCQDGITACGLYLALSFLLEKMAVDRECDVISAVRAVRRSRPEFVQSLEEFEYLYDAAVNYAECFQTYANFS